MPYRKFKADYLFDGYKLCYAGSVLITDETGKVIEVTDTENTGNDIETFAGILSPGFINAHCHLELSHLKNKIPEKTGLINFVFKVVTERHHEVDEIEMAIKKAIKEMWANGIVAVGDICNSDLTLLAKKNGSIKYYNFIEVSGWNPAVAEERFTRSRQISDVFIAQRQEVSIVPHAPYSVSYPLWEKIAPFFGDKVVTIHNKESEAEDEFFLKGEGEFNEMYDMMKIDNALYKHPGKSSIEYYFEKLFKASSVILVHNTFINRNDISHILKYKRPAQLLSFCLCPNANLYIENKLPPVDLLTESNLNIIIGTDSLASNHQLSVIEEMKTLLKEFPFLKTEQMLMWVTSNGAKALEMDNEFGTFETGKSPGIVLIENLQGNNFTNNTKARRIL